ncbi:LapA family protein [Tepidimonas charontis]|uniref:Lipopolysaccharide assembly protein A n=1 Tax=Tepidimonas charontis TaxID=2267262 RepID=A0A554XH60_9BURK|nr:LapA family protein [Tepidimonas charontis]TSE35170.1 Lipopolysaccharide assembly protein A [Tepidimonas charontis]
MKVLGWLFKAAAFVLVFALALRNQTPVQVQGLFGAQWEAPLALVLLITLCAGVLLGMAVMVPPWWRATRAARRAADPGAPSAPASRPSPDESAHGI